MEQLLRTQMQARYAPERLGHFGLALATYAHFTSPIRRYADLLVHRALVSAYRLGDGGLPPGEEERFEQIGEQISMLERRAMEAERETVDRYVAAFLADQVGQLVECRITGVQPFGFFAAVKDLGGDGLVFAKDLGLEYFRYDEAAQSAGRRRKRRDLSHRPAADAAAGGSEPGLRLAAFRASRGQLWRAQRRPAATRPHPPRPATEHPSQQSQAALNCAISRPKSGALDHAKIFALGRLCCRRAAPVGDHRRRGDLDSGRAEARRAWNGPCPSICAMPTPAQLADASRQLYVLRCADCHDKGLRGDLFFDEPNIATIYAPNLTQIAARASDEQLARAIRQGIGTDGRSLVIMPSATFSRLDDSEVAALIAAIRALPKAGQPSPPRRSAFSAGSAWSPASFKRLPSRSRNMRASCRLDLGPQYARGRHMVASNCAECHGADLGGGKTDLAEGAGSDDCRRLRPAGIQDAAAHRRACRRPQAQADGRNCTDSLSHMTDAEIEQIHAYLQARAQKLSR